MKALCKRKDLLAAFGMVSGVVPARSPKPILQNVKLVSDPELGTILMATDLEVGISAQTGEWDNTGNYNWSAGVFDAALHLGTNFELKGEYIKTWYGTDNMGEIRQDGWWVQGAYKLAGLPFDLPIIRNTELVARYDSLNDGFGTTTQRETAGFIYYFTNTLLLEGDYEWMNTNNLNPNQNPTGNMIVQLSLGF